VPESFKVLVKELQSLGLAVEVMNEEERAIPAERVKETIEPEKELPILEGSALLSDEPAVSADGTEESGEKSEEEPNEGEEPFGEEGEEKE